MTTGFSVNKDCVADIRLVGNEQTPVIVIDDAIDGRAALLDAAKEDASFYLDRRFAYPGVRSQLPHFYVNKLLEMLLELLPETYGIPAHYEHQVVHSLFSLITTPPEDLAVLQRVPHFDTLNDYYFATVHYLADGDHGGTALFRHRPTGYERIYENRYQAYVSAAEAHMQQHGLPGARYIVDSNDHYELIGKVDYKPNRLIVYPGNLLHSGMIKPETDIGFRPESGRLTANLFIDFADAP